MSESLEHSGLIVPHTIHHTHQVHVKKQVSQSGVARRSHLKVYCRRDGVNRSDDSIQFGRGIGNARKVGLQSCIRIAASANSRRDTVSVLLKSI